MIFFCDNDKFTSHMDPLTRFLGGVKWLVFSSKSGAEAERRGGMAAYEKKLHKIKGNCEVDLYDY